MASIRNNKKGNGFSFGSIGKKMKHGAKQVGRDVKRG